MFCNNVKSQVMPAVVHPTKCNVVESTCEYIVPEIHPSHTKNVSNHVYKHVHSFPHTVSYDQNIYHQHFVQHGQGPGTTMPPRPGMVAGAATPPRPGMAPGSMMPPRPGMVAGAATPPRPGMAPGSMMPPRPGMVAGAMSPQGGYGQGMKHPGQVAGAKTPYGHKSCGC